jgi:hypothetical protein
MEDKKISWEDARRVAMEGLEKAERERSEFAEKEACRGVQYEEPKSELEDFLRVMSRMECSHDVATGDNAKHNYDFGVACDNKNMPLPHTVVGSGQSYFFFDADGNFQGVLTDDTCCWIPRRK